MTTRDNERKFRDAIIDMILCSHELPGFSHIDDAAEECGVSEMLPNDIGAAVCRAACEGVGLLVENLLHTTNSEFGYDDGNNPEADRLHRISKHIMELNQFLALATRRYAR